MGLGMKASGKIIKDMVKAKCIILMVRCMKGILRRIKKMDLERKIIRLTYTNNKMYKGGFRNNNPHGKGTLYQPDGTIINGVWDMGNLISNS